MIKAIIIDDEKNAVEMLVWLLGNYCPDVEVEALCFNAIEGMEAIKKHHPQMIFLDIEMPGMNGFDLLEKLDTINFQIVFTTAHAEFAVKAFRFAALDYLLKPIDPEDLKATISRFKANQQFVDKDQLKLLLENLNPSKKQVERIALSSGDGLVFVKTADIIYCRADSNYTEVALADGKKILVARTLKEIDETLSGDDFIRVHNSYLVNINHIKKYVKGDGGYIIMPDNTQITISRSKREDFFLLFSKF
jgi:two-component system, LytTR family, response regulator